MTTASQAIEMSSKGNELEKRDMIVKETVYSPNVLILFITEVLGTAMLLFLGCMGVCVPELVDIPVVPHFAGIGFGLTVLIIIQAFGHISGAHLNPQVTIAAVILGKLKPALAPVYFLAEFVGAIAGFGLLKFVTPSTYLTADICGTVPVKHATPIQAIVIEAVITCVLIFVCGGVWDVRNADKADSVPIRFGFIVAGISIVAGPYTGASMNTARSFAPALINGSWDYHWIYWVGPTMGAVIGAVFYRCVLGLPKQRKWT